MSGITRGIQALGFFSSEFILVERVARLRSPVASFGEVNPPLSANADFGEVKILTAAATVFPAPFFYINN